MMLTLKKLLPAILGMTIINQGYALECETGQRLFSDELSVTGDVCIPENPMKIVALDMSAAELTLFTGKELSGAANWILSEMSVLSPEFSDELKAVDDIGYPANLEKLLTIKPDLILAVGSEAGVAQSIDVEKAQKIAPLIVASPLVYDDWKTSTAFWAKALNVEPTYEAMLQNYETRIAEVKTALGEKTQQSVSIIGISTYGKSLWLKDTPPARIVADLGFSRPAAQDYDSSAALAVYKDGRYPMISEEKLDLVDGDLIFGFGYPAQDESEIEKTQKLVATLQENALWKSLSAVQNDQFYQVDGHWWRCTSYLLASKVVDDIAVHLTGEKPQTNFLSPEK